MQKTLLAGSLFCLAAGGRLLLGLSAVSVQPAVISQTPDAKPALPQVEVLNLGAEPRQALRLQPSLETKQLSTITINEANQVTGDYVMGGYPDKTLMEVVMKIETIVTQIDRNGDIRSQFRNIDADLSKNSHLPSDVIESLEAQFALIKSGIRRNLAGEIVQNSRWQIDLTKMDSVTQQLLEQIEQISGSINPIAIAMPEAAVGVGAKWRVLSDVSDRNGFGVKIPQVTSYELLSLQNGTATLKVEVGQQITNQTKNLSELDFPPAGSSLMIKSLSTIGQGQMTINFDRIMPTSAQLTIQSKAEMAISFSKDEPPMVMNTDTKLDLTLTSE